MQTRHTRGAKKDCVIFSFFAGVGFLDLGFETSGYDVVFVNEIHKPFLKAYKHARKVLNLPSPQYGFHSGDMEDLTKGSGHDMLKKNIKDARKEKKLVGFIGGPPCPDFSAAGRNRGRNGAHGKLSETYITLIRQQKPDFFLFENVKGLWKRKIHREFYEELKLELQKNGYATTEKMINALEYGVAQDRDRVIFVGFRKELFPNSEESVLSFPWSTNKVYSRDTIEKIKKNKLLVIPEVLTVDFWFNKNKVTSHPNSSHHFMPHALSKFQNIKEGHVSGKSFKRLHRYRYSPTAAYGNNEVHLHPLKPRRISAAEALAIQSLPRKFSFPEDMTLTDMFKAIGNGVPYVAARAIAKSIRKFIEQHA